MGTTSTNIVFSHVSKIDRFIQTLIDLSLDPNMNANINLKPEEDQSIVLNATNEILNSLLS